MKHLFTFFLLLLILFSCSKEDFEKRTYARVQTLDVTNVVEEGATFNAEVTLPAGASIQEHGFIWSLYPILPEGEHNENSLGAKENGGVFSTTIDYALYKDTIYYVRAYVISEDYTVYGNVVKFKSKGSKPPYIIDFFPKQGTSQDTVRITGENFSEIIKENKVYFGKYEGEIIKSSNKEILCVVPFDISEPAVRLQVYTVNYQSNLSADNFVLGKPSITSFEPLQATFGDKITIRGLDFKDQINGNIVKFGNIAAKVISASSAELIVEVPDSINLPSTPIAVSVSSQIAYSEEKFSLIPPVINMLSPLEAYVRGVIKIDGNYFSPISSYNNIYFNDLKVPVYRCCSNNTIFIEIPDTIYMKRKLQVGIETLGNFVQSSKCIDLKGWLKKPDLPESRESMTSFSIGDDGYIGLGKAQNATDFWKFNHNTHVWEWAMYFPGKPRYKAISFIINNNAYIGGGVSVDSSEVKYNDFWRYNSESNSWSQLQRFPTELSEESIAFSAKGKGYICTATNPSELWEYNPISNVWTKRAEIASNRTNSRPYAGFEQDGKIYIYVSTDATSDTQSALYDYDSNTFEVIKIAENIFSSYIYGNPNTFSIQNKTYFLFQGERLLHQFDSASKKIVLLEDSDINLLRRDRFVGFAIFNSIYIGGGFGSPGGTGYQLLNDFFEYSIE